MSKRDLEEELRTQLREERVPDSDQARERARILIRSAYGDRETIDSHSAGWRRRFVQVAVAIGLIAIVVSPAGAAVRDWVRETVNLGQEDARPALTSLPAPGRLLVESRDGAWVVNEDGSKRLLGRFDDATWSPRGLFIAATTRHQLVALDPEGEVRWTLTRDGPVGNPSWNSPDGFRIAYLDGGSLRVVAGDGSGDQLVRKRVARLTAAWKPGSQYILAYAKPDGIVSAVAADSGKEVFSIPASGFSRGGKPIGLQWSADGRRLLVVRSSGIEIYDDAGELVWEQAVPDGMTVTDGALDPIGESVAIVSSSDSGGRSRLGLIARRCRRNVCFSAVLVSSEA